jgi:hypothetical protein
MLTFFAYSPSFTGGLSVALGDINGDGVEDIITGAGPGGGPHVKVFDGRTGKSIDSFFAFEATFTGGVWVASADVNGDGTDDIVIGAGAGGGPAVAVFDGATGQIIRKFFAYASTFTGGVYVAAGDVIGSKNAEVIVGAGPGGGPHVQMFDGNSGQTLISFFAADQRLVSRDGTRVGTSYERDGTADIIAASGAGAGSKSRIATFGFTTQPLAPIATELPLLEPFLGAVFVGGK